MRERRNIINNDIQSVAVAVESWQAARLNACIKTKTKRVKKDFGRFFFSLLLLLFFFIIIIIVIKVIHTMTHDDGSLFIMYTYTCARGP